MTVSTIQLMFDSGSASGAMRAMPQSRSSQIDAALRCMVAEARAGFRHSVWFRMQDGSLVVAKPRVQA